MQQQVTYSNCLRRSQVCDLLPDKHFNKSFEELRRIQAPCEGHGRKCQDGKKCSNVVAVDHLCSEFKKKYPQLRVSIYAAMTSLAQRTPFPAGISGLIRGNRIKDHGHGIFSYHDDLDGYAILFWELSKRNSVYIYDISTTENTGNTYPSSNLLNDAKSAYFYEAQSA